MKNTEAVQEEMTWREWIAGLVAVAFVLFFMYLFMFRIAAWVDAPEREISTGTENVLVAPTGIDKGQQTRIEELDRKVSAILQTLPDKERCRIEYEDLKICGSDWPSAAESCVILRPNSVCGKYLEKTESVYKIP